MRYYCHICKTQISELSPEFTCPVCHSGFVEEIPAQASRRSSGADESNRTGSDDGIPGFISSHSFSDDQFSDDNSDVEFLEPLSVPLARVIGLLEPQQQSTIFPATNTAGQSSQQQPDNNASNARRIITRSVNRSLARNNASGQMHPENSDSNNPSWAQVLNNFLTTVTFDTHYPEGPSSGQSTQNTSGVPGSGGASRGLVNIDFPLPLFLHSNPGDYAWGSDNFDAVITRLLNNLDGSNSGPPPMPMEQVDKLPFVKISDDQVKNSSLQCTVCMDDFQVDDNARQLPCEHIFHQDCILPWLKLHASCPICRKTFITSSDPAQTLGQSSSNEAPLYPDATVNPTTNVATSGSSVVEPATNRNTTSSSTVTNQNVRPNYDYTEDDCD